MKINFTDFPTYFSVQEYDAAITKMVEILSCNKDILSIFQVGGVSSPGISDIDFYVIFKNECQFLHNPVANLTFPANYFFSHRLFGTCEKFAVDFEKYTFFRSYKLLAGQNINMLNYDLNEIDIQILQHQIALEYLIKAWLNISISLIYKEVKVRDLLLHAKAILYDIEFLSIEDEEFKGVINEIMTIRKNWFETPVSLSKLQEIVEAYQQFLFRAITNSIAKFGFYRSPKVNPFISKRVKLSNYHDYEINRTGLLLPPSLVNQSKKLLKIQKNINKFDVRIPIIETDIPSILQKRQKLLHQAITYNNIHLPGFLCTAYGMNIFEN